MALNVAARLDRAIKAAGVAIVGVSIGSETDNATWKVQPVNLQAAAQSTIDTFNPAAQSVVDAEVAEAAALTSRRKDILATCALIVRSRDIAAWNAMTVLQKKNATLAEADVWATIREFVEKNT